MSTKTKKNPPRPKQAGSSPIRRGAASAAVTKTTIRDIEDLLKSERPSAPPGAIESLKYEIDPFNNRIVPRPLIGGVGRRGKLYELTESDTFSIGTNKIGYYTFNPDVWTALNSGNQWAVPVGPYQDALIGSKTSSAFTGTTIPTTATLATGETNVQWKGSKYTLPSTPGMLQWQCVGYGIRVVRTTKALDQNGDIVLYRSYNGENVDGFNKAAFTANKNFRMVSGADVAPGAREIIIAGSPSQLDASDAVTSSLFWNERLANATLNTWINRSGCCVFATGQTGDTFSVDIVAGYMLIGRSVSPKVRFGASALSADFLSNARLSVVKPGRNTTPEETQRGVDALVKHQTMKEDGLLDIGFKHFKNVGKAMLRDSSKIGAVLETLL